MLKWNALIYYNSLSLADYLETITYQFSISQRAQYQLPAKLKIPIEIVENEYRGRAIVTAQRMKRINPNVVVLDNQFNAYLSHDILDAYLRNDQRVLLIGQEPNPQLIGYFAPRNIMPMHFSARNALLALKKESWDAQITN